MAKNTVATKPPKNYEDAMSELENLLSDMEQGNLSLDDTLVAYARGAELLKFCREKLAVVDAQVKVLDAGALKEFAPTPAQEGAP
jgi:exodeoxyribonuclease VII small subunit